MRDRGFGSDNHSGIHPQLLDALVKANTCHVPSYGMDADSKKLQVCLRKIFDCECESFLVFNGTAANVLALKSTVHSFQSILATNESHLAIDECAAPEAHLGSKIHTVPHIQGKLSGADFKTFLVRRGDQHAVQPGAVSLTQPTEYGTVYTLKELADIFLEIKSAQLKSHMDGARFFQAVHYLKCSPSELTHSLGLDVLTLSGTKNGLMGGELVIFFNRELAKNFKFIRKQGMQLPAKTRFIAAQFLEYFESGLYLKLAEHQHQMATYLAEQLTAIEGVVLEYPVQSNAVFVRMPLEILLKFKKRYFFYIWLEGQNLARLMTTFDTDKQLIDEAIEYLKSLFVSKTVEK